MGIDETVDRVLNEGDVMAKGKRKNVKDWNKVINVIQSIDSMKQVESAKNLIINYKKMHGLDASHELLELELKMKSRSLRR